MYAGPDRAGVLEAGARIQELYVILAKEAHRRGKTPSEHALWSIAAAAYVREAVDALLWQHGMPAAFNE